MVGPMEPTPLLSLWLSPGISLPRCGRTERHPLRISQSPPAPLFLSAGTLRAPRCSRGLRGSPPAREGSRHALLESPGRGHFGRHVTGPRQKFSFLYGSDGHKRSSVWRPEGRNEEVILFMLWKLLRVCCLLTWCIRLVATSVPPGLFLQCLWVLGQVCMRFLDNECQLSCRSPTALKLEWFRDRTGSQFVLRDPNLCSCTPTCSLHPAFLCICSCARSRVTLGSTQTKNQQPAQTVLP